jgi:hypothetical protein
MGLIIDYEQIEDDVVAHLGVIAGLEIVALPQSEAEFSKPFNNKITIAYGGSKYRDSEGLGYIAQREEVDIVVFFESRKTRGDNGIYKSMATIKEKLIGFEPTFCGKMFLKEQSPMKRDDGIFSFHQVYGCHSFVSETLPDTNDVPMVGIDFIKN